MERKNPGSTTRANTPFLQLVTWGDRRAGSAQNYSDDLHQQRQSVSFMFPKGSDGASNVKVGRVAGRLAIFIDQAAGRHRQPRLGASVWRAALPPVLAC